MADDEAIAYDAAADDDFYSVGNATDDYSRYKNNYSNFYPDDDEYYFSTKASSWLDGLLSDTVASNENGKLTPVEDVNPDNVLATLIFNSIVCIMLLGLYELLRRWIPSVYSQRLIAHDRSNKNITGVERRFAQTSKLQASGRSLQRLRVAGSMMSNGDGIDAANGKSGNDELLEEERKDEEVGCDEGGLPMACHELNDEVCKSAGDMKQEAQTCNCCFKPSSFPVLEWAIPVHATPWSTLRRLAGLDAYFYLRYIRMCLKITAVSSFWAIAILCPVYATGGGDQAGFYHFSMANVLQDDWGRVWVPTIFCWAFTMYCFFCVRMEMIHYIDLRMEFLGGEEEERILRQRESLTSTGEREGGTREGSYGAPKEDAVTVNTQNGESEKEGRSRSRSPLLAADGPEGAPAMSALAQEQSTISPPPPPPINLHVQMQMKQHRYSLQVEKVPAALRSNTALFTYFNDMFPGQVHSACVAMNVPDLVALSARRMKVCRRLEKSLAYHTVTGIRPTHIAGRPRCQCCGIESTPLDGWCVTCCCVHDRCKRQNYLDADDVDYPTEVYERLPDKGECVDSILYYTCDLALSNIRMRKLQEEKFLIAETGNSPRNSTLGGGGNWGHRDGGPYGEGESNCGDWYERPLGMLKTGAATVAEGLRDEFEVSGEEDYLGDGVTRSQYGAFSMHHTQKQLSRWRRGDLEKKASPLIEEDHLTESDPSVGDSSVPAVDGMEDVEKEGTAGVSIGSIPPSSLGQKESYRSRPYVWIRAILWRMGVDFLAAGLDEVRNSTDVVVDSVTRPSMSSTGFVTFKTLTPVTVTTSAPLTYDRTNPMEVIVAPEPRDIVWQNVQIDRDIGSGRAFVADVLLGLGVLLWSIPLTLIQAWAKVENVALIPGLEWVDQIQDGAWKSFINGYLPVITLLGLILLLPLIFQWVATSYEKRKTLSDVQNSIVGRYFYYQLANIYITVTAGALWTSLGIIIDHPQKLLVILGDTLPKLAGYFISLLITKTLAGLPMVLLRVGALSRMMFLRSCFNKKRLTHRELKEVYRKQPIHYGWEYPTQFLVIIVCFTYACITPFVLPVGAAYYFMALLVYKKQALYVYTPTYESGGRMFPQAVSKTLFALLISQLTFIGYTLIRKGVFQIILLAPLPFLTVFFNMLIQSRYVEPSKKLSLERAVKIDALSDKSLEFSDEAYQQPMLTEKAAVPICETDDHILAHVIENLERLQHESSQI